MWPSGAVGDSGLPGLTSMNMLPSRNRRGRSLKVASSLIGWPSESISIVTIAACTPLAPLWGGFPVVEAVVVSPPSTPPQAGLSFVHGSTLMTLPTFTPAIRTGEFGTMFCAVVNTALTS